MIRQLRVNIKGSKLNDILKHKTIKPFAYVLRPIIESIKLKSSQRPKDYTPTIIDKLCGNINSSKTNKLLVEAFFKDAAFRAIFNFFSQKLIDKGYKPCRKRAETRLKAKNTKKGDMVKNCKKGNMVKNCKKGDKAKNDMKVDKGNILPPRVQASDEEKIKRYNEVVEDYKAFSVMLGKVMDRYPD